MTKTKKAQPGRKIRHKTWNDLKNDVEQQKIYEENIEFVATLYSEYAKRKRSS